MSWQAGPHPDDEPRTRVVDEPVPFAPRRTVVVMRPRADTSPAVAPELMPLVPVILWMMSVLFTRGWSVEAVVGAAIPTAILQFVLAIRDGRTRADRGFVDRASALLALVSPLLYLAVRARRCEGHDPDAWSAARWAVGATVLALVMVLIGVGFQAAIAPLFDPHGA